MSSSKPFFVLLPGSWCPAAYYEKLTPLLEQQGYEALALDLPTTRGEGPPSTFYDDADFVRSRIERLADQGKKVIVVGNSYGGFLANECCKGVLASDRKSAGKEGGVIHVVILDSLLPPTGTTVAENLQGHIPLNFDNLPTDWLPGASPEMAHMAFFGSMSQEEGLKYGGMIANNSAKAFGDKITFAAYEHVATTVVVGSKDMALKPEVQEKRVDEVLRSGNMFVKKVSRGCETGSRRIDADIERSYWRSIIFHSCRIHRRLRRFASKLPKHPRRTKRSFAPRLRRSNVVSAKK